MFSITTGGALTSLVHLTASFPKKSKCRTSPSILICSGLRVIAPPVSASPGSFSSPTRMFKLIISQHTVATFLLPSSGETIVFITCSSISRILFPSFSAFLNFSFSLICFKNAESENQTYLIFPESLSSHLARYILSGSQTIAFHSPSGLGMSGDRFKIMSDWLGPCFHLPLFGWSPRPAKRQDGSDVQLAISISLPSTIAWHHIFLNSSLLAFLSCASLFFSSFVI